MLKSQRTPGKAPFLAAILKIACWFVTEMWNLGHKWNVCVKISGHLKNYTTSSKVARSNITPNPKGFCPSENQMPTKNIPPAPFIPLKEDLFSNLHFVKGNSPQEKSFCNNSQIVLLCLVIAFTSSERTSCHQSAPAQLISLGFFSLPFV